MLCNARWRRHTDHRDVWNCARSFRSASALSPSAPPPSAPKMPRLARLPAGPALSCIMLHATGRPIAKAAVCNEEEDWRERKMLPFALFFLLLHV